MFSKLLCIPTVFVGMSMPLDAADTASSLKNNVAIPVAASDGARVQIAILLDTSGSMKGLVDQTRCQLWNVVTELSKASLRNTPSRLEIAVYQYGTESVVKNRGCLRKVTDFTDDLDEVSKAIFSLAIGGGDEFCGQVLDDATNDLDWDPSTETYKAVFIAGNESFDQGTVPFGDALSRALSGSILINSIYCFDKKYSEATQGMEQWESAANLTGGMYFQIDHNHHFPSMMTPYDARMRELNRKMNETFVWYGKNANKAAKNQKNQDRNAAKMSDDAFAARMSAKIGHLYHHVHDDLIDAVSHGVVDLDRMPVDEMPETIQSMTAESRSEYVQNKIAERNRVRREMAEVISKRHAFLQRKMSEQIGETSGQPQVLGDALIEAVRRQATQRGFEFSDAKNALASQTP